MSITLKVQYGTDQKVVKYASSTPVHEVLANCIKKFRIPSGEDHAMLLPPSNTRPIGKWLLADRTLEQNDVQTNDILECRKKHAQLKIKLTDGTTKTLKDTSLPTLEVCKFIGDKLLIRNGEEFGLQVERTNDSTHKQEITWLDPNRTLGEQGINEDSHLIYKKQFFVDDAFISTDDPASIHVLYLEAHTAIVEGKYPCSQQEAILFASFQCQYELRNHNPEQHHEGTLKLDQFVPSAYLKTKNIEQAIFKEHKKLSGMTEVNAKFRYIQLCRSLKTYGMSDFKVQMPKHSNSKKLVDKYLGITKQGLFILDGKTKSIEKEFPLDHLRRWSHTDTTFTLDFGTYEDDYVNCNTTEGEAINILISGYIDLIMKRLQNAGTSVGDGSGTAEISADLTDRPAGKRGTVNTSNFARNEEAASPSYYTTARRTGRPNADGSQPQVAQELTAAIASINRLLDASDKEEAEKAKATSEAGGTQTEEEISESSRAELKAQVAANMHTVNTVVASLLSPLTNSFVNGTKLSVVEIGDVHKRCAPQVATLVESMLALANSKGIAPKARSAMLAAAKNIASTMATLLLATQDAAANPDDPVAQENVYRYSAQLVPSLVLMDTLSRGTEYKSVPDLMDLAKQSKGAATALQAAIAKAADSFESPVIKTQVQLLAAQLAGHDKNLQEIIESLGPYLSDPAVQKTLHDVLKIYTAHVSYLGKCASYEVGEGVEAISATITDLKSALNGISVQAVGVELEPKIEPEQAPVAAEPVDETEKLVQDELESATRALRELGETLRETQQYRRQTVRIKSMDPKDLENEMINQELGEGILDATKLIALASEKLMLTAIGLQKELVAAGKASKTANPYKKDPAWAQGLISASQSVTFAIRQLVVAAQGASRGDFDEERMKALANNVNAAAIRLVTSAKVKAAPNSPFIAQLAEVHKAVLSATGQLIDKAKRPTVVAASTSLNQPEMSATSKAIREIEVQTKILKLQKALEEAQVELANIRKEDYSGSVTPAPAATGFQKATPRKTSSTETPVDNTTRKQSNATNGGMWPSLRKTSVPAAALQDSTPSTESSTPAASDVVQEHQVPVASEEQQQQPPQETAVPQAEPDASAPVEAESAHETPTPAVPEPETPQDIPPHDDGTAPPADGVTSSPEASS